MRSDFHMRNFKDAFIKYIYDANVHGSGKAASYVKALVLLCQMIEAKSYGFDDCKNIWVVDSVNRLHELYLLVIDEARKRMQVSGAFKVCLKAIYKRAIALLPLNVIKNF